MLVGAEDVERDASTISIFVERSPSQRFDEIGIRKRAAHHDRVVTHLSARVSHEPGYVWDRLTAESYDRCGRRGDFVRAKEPRVRGERGAPQGAGKALDQLLQGEVAEWEESSHQGRYLVRAERDELVDE